MKFFSLVTLFTISTFAWAQNQRPVVSNVRFSVKDTSIQRNYITQMVTVTYDLADAENDAMTVSLRVSKDYGNSFSVVPIAAIGDIGPNMTAGSNKTITWIPGPGEQIENARRYVYRVIADDGGTVNIDEVIARIDSNRIKQFFAEVYGNNHPFHADHYQHTRNLLKEHYQANNYRLYTDQFVTNDRNHPELLKDGMNILGNRSGLLKDSTVLMSGHYDNIDTTRGADDNNIAVACVLAASEALNDQLFENNISFANWDMEEDGLVGATYYSTLPQAQKAKAVINFDGIGIYKTEPNSQRVPTGFNALFPLAYQKAQADSFRGNFVALIGDSRSAVLVQQTVLAAQTYTPDLRYIDLTCPDPGCQVAKDLRRSDHAPFWDRLIPSVFFTSTTEFRSDCYHKPCDTVVNFTYSTKVVKLATALLMQQAKPIHAGFSQSSLPTGITDRTGGAGWSIEAPFPNPVAHHAYIRVSLPENDRLCIRVYDLQGKEVDRAFEGNLAAGAHTLLWQAKSDLPTGLYVLKAQSDKGLLQSYRVAVDLQPDDHSH